jgi:fermentation-respiration switch protein FrsA (DUF1100 family)
MSLPEGSTLCPQSGSRLVPGFLEQRVGFAAPLPRPRLDPIRPKDELVPFSEAEALYAAHAGPRWHWWVEDASHDNVRRRNTAEYLCRLRSFLEARLNEAAPPPAISR